MTTTVATLVNVFTPRPGATQAAVLASLKQNTETVIMTLNGWISTTLVAGNDGERVAIYSQWESPADIDAMRTDPRMIAYFPGINELAALESITGTAFLVHERSSQADTHTV